MSAARDVLTVVIVAGLVLFTNLGSFPLFDEDEPKNAVCGREMFERGDWVVPTFNGDLRTEKPVLVYWLMLCSFNVLGVSEFSARLGSSVMSIGAALGTFFIGRRLYDRQVGLLAAVAVVTCLMFSAVGRAVTPDATLVCCLTWCFYGFVSSREWRVESREPANPSALFANRNYLLAFGMMGLAMLAKGPIGFLLPCMVIGVFGLCLGAREDLSAGRANLGDGPWWKQSLRLTGMIVSPARFFRTLWAMKLWIGVPIAFGIALPWYVAVTLRTDGAWTAGFLGVHNVGRFLAPMESHRGPVFYYFLVLFAGAFPWSVFLPLAARDLWRRLQTGSERGDADLFTACWALTWLVFFSTAQTKLPNYILPMYPAVALIVARSLIGWMRCASVRNFLLECRVLAIAGVAMILGLIIATSVLFPDEMPLALLGVIPVITGAVAFRLAQDLERERAVLACACGAVALAVGVTGWAPVELARYQDSPFFAAAARESGSAGDPEVAMYEVFEPSLVFYHGRKVHLPHLPSEVTNFFEAHPDGLMLTRADALDRLPDATSDGWVEVARQKRFLRKHDLVLLGRATVIAAGHRETH